jgi:hypothetical protein
VVLNYRTTANSHLMTQPETSEPASGCSGHDHDHDHEEEKSGCTCGGPCGRQKMLENFRNLASEAGQDAALELTPENAS